VPSSLPLRRLFLALLLSCTVLVSATACGDSAGSPRASGTEDVKPTNSAEKQKYAKAKFVANAGLAAGATYQWIVKPYRTGKFKKGADGRTVTMVKAGLAGLFAYNRLKAAVNNAKGDPALSKAVAPLTKGVEKLKGLDSKIREGDAGEGDIRTFESVIKSIKDAGKSAGAEVTDKVPSLSELKA
jgi:hypothetical protein